VAAQSGQASRSGLGYDRVSAESSAEEEHMGARADMLAKRFEEANQTLTDAVAKLSDADWKKTTSAEKWPVAVVAHHVAVAHAGIAGLVKSIASGQHTPSLTMAMIDEGNAKHAKEFANCTKAEALELHKKNAAAAAAVVRGLSDAELDRSGSPLSGMPVMTTHQVVEGVLINHVNEHLGSIRATVAKSGV
jgi:uncharacterized damage-inducible protein DinB